MSAISSDSRSRQFILVAACFLLSGFAALLYETVWLRQFAILLGTSEQALAIVLASYMGGLALGAAVAGKFVDRIQRPLLTYGVLEFLIAVTALLIPFGLELIQGIRVSLFGGSPEPPAAGGFAQGLFAFGAVFGLIAIPTGLMGATLPLLARFAVHEEQQIGPRIGLLYAINTFGAVAGTLTAAFVCLPVLGLARTTWIGAAVNVAVFALVVLLVRVSAREPGTLNPTVSRTAELKAQKNAELTHSSGAGSRWVLLLIAISGAVSFCYEIIFTRMLGHVLGGSLFSFATMLAAFLLGIALGGAIASRVARWSRQAMIGFVYAEALVAVMALYAFRSVDRLAASSTESWASDSVIQLQVSASILALLPTAICIGATFPLAIRIFARDENDAASAAAQVYCWNVVGGILGAIATGAMLLPLLQYHGAAIVAVAINLVLAAVSVVVFKLDRRHLAGPGMGLLFLLVLLPKQPENILRVSALDGSVSDGDVLFNHVGKSATVSVFYDRGGVAFQTNGLSEARLSPPESGLLFVSEANWLTALPPMIRPETESMLVVGLGGGAAVEQMAPSLKSIDVIELEPEVVRANRTVASLRTHDPLSDSRIHIILNDGRNALALTEKRYDAIVSQPSHPWTAGASHLYTREFAEIVRPRLNPGGIFLQWMSSAFVDDKLINSMGATLLDVFPHARLYQPMEGLFLFVASDEPIRPEALPVVPGTEPSLCVLPQMNQTYYRRLGMATRTHLISALSLDEQGLRDMCEGATVIADERNLLAMDAPRLIRRGPTDAAVKRVEQFSPLHRGVSAMEQLCPTFDPTAFAKRLYLSGRLKGLRDTILSLITDPADLAYSSLAISDVSQDDELKLVVKLQEAYPNDSRFAFMLLRKVLMGKLAGVGDDRIEELKAKLSKQEADVIKMMEATFRNDFATARRLDETVAAVAPDSVAFDSVVSMQIPWRLETRPPESVLRAREALEIIDDNIAFLTADVSWLRVVTAIKAGRSLAALGGTTMEVKKAERLLAAGKRVNGGNLRRIRQVLADPRPFQSIPNQRYRDVIASLDRLLRALPR